MPILRTELCSMLLWLAPPGTYRNRWLTDGCCYDRLKKSRIDSNRNERLPAIGRAIHSGSPEVDITCLLNGELFNTTAPEA